MAKNFILLPNQLFKSLPAGKTSQIVLVEASAFFSDYKFHKQKLTFHRASLKYYQSFLEKKGYNVLYLDHQMLLQSSGLGEWLKKKKINRASLFDPIDKQLKTKLEKELNQGGVEFVFLGCPLFFCEENYIKDFFCDKDHYSMNSFYISQRKRLNILLDNNKPQGGKWSFDKENRNKLEAISKLP